MKTHKILDRIVSVFLLLIAAISIYNNVFAHCNPNDVSSGKENVKANVEYIHNVEHQYEAAKNPIEEHFMNPVKI